jgi:hypothetical protein
MCSLSSEKKEAFKLYQTCVGTPPTVKTNANTKSIAINQAQRILQRNVLYIVNLPACLARASLLSEFAYLGQYGRITNIHLKSDA